MSKEKYLEGALECIHCGKEFTMDEVFVCHIKPPDDTVTICTCLNCGEASTRPEKVGGWLIVRRTLEGYEVKGQE